MHGETHDQEGSLGPHYLLGLHQVGRFLILMVCALTNLASLQICLLLHCKGDDGLVTIRAVELIHGSVLQPSNSGGHNIPTDVPGLGEGDTESSHLYPVCVPHRQYPRYVIMQECSLTTPHL